MEAELFLTLLTTLLRAIGSDLLGHYHHPTSLWLTEGLEERKEKQRQNSFKERRNDLCHQERDDGSWGELDRSPVPDPREQCSPSPLPQSTSQGTNNNQTANHFRLVLFLLTCHQWQILIDTHCLQQEVWKNLVLEKVGESKGWYSWHPF